MVLCGVRWIYARRYLLGKQVVLWPNQSHWLAAFFTLHSLLSFLAARGKAFGHFKWREFGQFLYRYILNVCVYDSVADVPKSWVWWRAYFQSGSRVFKNMFWTFSYLYLGHTMWFHAKKLLKTLKFWKSLNSLCKSGSGPQKSPKKAQKTDHSIAIYSNLLTGMVYSKCYLVNPHVQTVQNMHGKGG